MGEFSRQLLEVNGESGYTYRLRRRDEGHFDMDALNEVRHRAIAMGHQAIIGALQVTAEGEEGIIKLQPKLEAYEISLLGAETHISAEPVLH